MSGHIEPNDHVTGPADARVTIVEYGDYQCPYTARAHDALADLRERMKGRLRLAYRHLPLSHLHPDALLAAEAAEAAGAQGKFWEMHATLFDNQGELDPDSLAELANDLQLDVQRFQHELKAGTYRQRVLDDAARGHADGASGTPTFFINGERYHGDSDPESLGAAIDKALG
ncbi:MAG: DsbA family protein [Telluria sp.]